MDDQGLDYFTNQFLQSGMKVYLCQIGLLCETQGNEGAGVSEAQGIGISVIESVGEMYCVGGIVTLDEVQINASG